MTNFTKLSFRNLVKQNMKGISKNLLIIAIGMCLFLSSCASSRNCGCNDLTKKNAPPKSHKRNIF
jgi:hypothetical protein